MSRHQIVFYGSDETPESELKVFYNVKNEIFISIDMKYNEISDYITLDKETAIKLVRVLKREISKIQD